MIKITGAFYLNESEVSFTFIRSPGPGGQNVNKVATAVVLRFNVMQSPSLSEVVRQRLMVLAGSKMTLEGDLVIKASRLRTQERNKQDALNRLVELLQRAATIPKKRRKTKPTYSSVQERLSSKKLKSKVKSLRGKKPGKDE
jgi:ribosome-associated protein